jgi:hypothetical protein
MATIGVCPAKAALFQWVKATPDKRFSRKQTGVVVEILKALKPSGTASHVYSTSVDEKCVRKVRNPMALLAANRRCLEIVHLAIRHAEAAWNFERLQQVPDEIIDAIAV